MATQTNSIPGSGYGNPYIDSLVWGSGWTNTSTPIRYWFGSGPVAAVDSSIGAFSGHEWSDAEKSAFGAAMAQYAAVSNLTFTAAISGSEADADIVWWLAPQSAMGAGSLGLHEVPDTSWSPIYGYFNYQDPSWSYLEQGQYGFVTVIHELGHGMGLAHPHDGGDHRDATIFPGVRGPWSTGNYGLNQGIWTTMSYNDGWDKMPSNSDAYGWQGTLMALDVAALQAIYGANTTTATGDNTYQLPDSNGAGTFWSCIWDAGGVDTISNQGSVVAGIINLNEAPLVGANAGGYVSADSGVVGGFTIAHGVVIENALGGAGNDTLIGNAANNVLDGGVGQDIMSGGAGNDSYYVDNIRDSISEASGGGTDTVYAAISYTLGKNIENLALTDAGAINGTGNTANNWLTGNEAVNLLNGSSGNDILVGAGGADRLTGGRGMDTFLYLDLLDSPSGSLSRDTIIDFKASEGDHINLSAIDANTGLEGDQAFSYIGSAPFSAAGQIHFSAGLLSADTNGDGLAELEIMLVGVKVFDAAMLLA